jgi:hypothetical protein
VENLSTIGTISTDSDHLEERSAITDAVNELLALKFDRLNYPNWNHNGM